MDKLLMLNEFVFIRLNDISSTHVEYDEAFHVNLVITTKLSKIALPLESETAQKLLKYLSESEDVEKL